MAAAFVALACRSPTPLHPAAEAEVKEEAAAHASQRPPPTPPTAPPELPVEAEETPELLLVRAVLAERAGHLAEPQRGSLAEILVEVSWEHDLSALLLLALIQEESCFDPAAKGPRGAIGLMQLRPFVGEKVAGRIGLPWQGQQTLLDPVANVRLGARYLAELLDRFGTHELALAAYNMGPSRLARRLDRGEGRRPAFVDRVLQTYEDLRRTFATSEAGIGG